MNVSPNTGPLGKERGILFVIFISILTLGIYYLYWVYKNHEEIKEHSGQGIGGVLGLVIAIVVGFITPFVLPSEIRRMYERDGRESRISGWTGLWASHPRHPHPRRPFRLVRQGAGSAKPLLAH